MPTVTLEQARAAKTEAEDIFRRIGDVLGVGITKVGDDYAIKVNLRGPVQAASSAPSEIHGVKIKVELVGSIRKR